MKDLNKFEDLRFNLTEEMNNMMIELLVTNQMLKDSLKKDTTFTDEERGLLYNHFQEIMDDFRKEFKKHNKKEIKQYNDLMKQ